MSQELLRISFSGSCRTLCDAGAQEPPTKTLKYLLKYTAERLKDAEPYRPRLDEVSQAM